MTASINEPEKRDNPESFSTVLGGLSHSGNVRLGSVTLAKPHPKPGWTDLILTPKSNYGFITPYTLILALCPSDTGHALNRFALCVSASDYALSC